MLSRVVIVPKKKARFELRVDQEWLNRVEKQADRFGLTVAAYIRLATQIKLEADEGSAVEGQQVEAAKTKKR